MGKEGLTQAALMAVIRYDPDTGLFTWLGTHGKVRAGKVAGHQVKTENRVKLRLNGELYTAHRLAWLYMTGAWPAGDIDHRDGDGLNNRWSNLRDVSHAVNMQNEQRARKNSTHGYLGVVRSPSGKWWARIRLPKGKRAHLGTFDTPEQAHVAYVAAKRLLHEGCTI